MRLGALKWLTTGALLLAARGAFAADPPSADAPPATPTPTAAPDASTPAAAPAAPTTLAAPAETAPAEDLTTKLGGWSVTLYGQVAVNVMHDSTQSFGVSSGNTMLQRRGTFRGNNDQLQLTSKDSRIGLRINLPDYGSIKTLAVIETDFGATLPVESTENATYIQTPLRMRLFYLQLQTPVIDLTAGQMQDLFGWGGKGFYPNTLAFQGITGQVYHRQTAVRLSKTVRPGGLELEAAVAATKPVQRASGLPEGQGGVRLALPAWSTVRAQGYARPGVGALSLGVSGVARRLEVAEFLEYPGASKKALGWGFAIDGFIPIIPVTNVNDRRNALSIVGEFSTGTGISDLYTDLTGGALFPTLTNPQDRQQPTNPPPVYPQNIDSGIVTFDGDSNLRTINWQAFLVGASYFLPFWNGRIWVSGNFSQVKSNNIVKYTPIPGHPFVYSKARYWDANAFMTVTDHFQVGYSFQSVEQTFGDDVKAKNYRNEVGLHVQF
jgi:hypothetical protein